MKHEADIAPRIGRPPSKEDFVRAKAMYAAEEGVEGQWLLTWGKPKFKDFPEWLANQQG